MPTSLHKKTCPDCGRKISAYRINYNHKADCPRVCGECGGEVTDGHHNENHRGQPRQICHPCNGTVDPLRPLGGHYQFCIRGLTG